MAKFLNKKIIITFTAIVGLSFFYQTVFAVWNGTFYDPGDTLNPECLPTDVDCNVRSPLTAINIDDTAYGVAWDTDTTHAPSKNAVYDKIEGLVAGSHDILTLGTANGLSLVNQVLSLALASTSTTGALSDTDWNTFNNKQNALTSDVDYLSPGTATSTYVPYTGATTNLNLGANNYIGTGTANRIGTATTADVLADTLLATSATTQKGLVIQAKTSHTANLFEIQRSTGTVMYSFASDANTNATIKLNGTYFNAIENINASYPTLRIGGNPVTFGNSSGFASISPGYLTFLTGNVYDATTSATISVAPQAWADNPSRPLTIRGANARSANTTNITGANTIITGGGGASASAGLASGGDVLIDGGIPYGTGVAGDIILGGTRGNVGIGTTSPTAVLHLKAGTIGANTAPLKFTSGDLMTTAEVGAVEFLNDAFYGTITTGAERKQFAFTSDLTSGYVPYTGANANLDLGNFTLTTPSILSPIGTTLGISTTAPTATTGSSQAGIPLTITASNAVASTDTAGAAAGGSVTITAGNAARLTSGNANGGDVNLTPGTGIGTGTIGSVVVGNNATIRIGTGVNLWQSGGTGDLYVGNSGRNANGSIFASRILGGGLNYYLSYDGLRLQNTALIQWTPDWAAYSATPDLTLRRIGAANPGWGLASATPVAYTHTMASNATGTDIAGANATIQPGMGTGSATPSNLYFSTADVGASGTTLQTATPKMTILGSGNIGIGTATPTTHKLMVSESVQVGTAFSYTPTAGTIDLSVGSPTANSRFLFGQSNTAYGGLTWNYNATPASAYMTLFSGTSSNNVMSFLQNGNVGIGTTTPTTAKLVLADTTLAGSAALAGGVLDMTQTWNTTGAPTAIKLNVTNTASAATSKLLDLQVGGTSLFNVAKNGQAIFRSNNGPIVSIYGITPYDRLFGGWQWDVINSRDALVTYGATDLAFNAGGLSTTRMLVRGDTGNVGIGITAPTSRIHGVTTLSAATGDEVAYRLDYTTNKATSGADTGLLINMTDTASPGTSLPLDIKVGGSSKFSVSNTGVIQQAGCTTAGTLSADVSGNIICTPSSERFKDNINDLDDSLSNIMALRPVSYNFNSSMNMGNGTYFGFISEEVALISSQFATHDKNGAPYGLDTNAILASTIKAIQEMNLSLEDVSGLEGEVNDGSFFSRLLSKLTTWLADTGNGIKNIFVEKVETKEICVSDDSGAKTCITKTQLDALLLNASTTSAPAPTPTPEPEVTPEPEPEPVVDSPLPESPQGEVDNSEPVDNSPTPAEATPPEGNETPEPTPEPEPAPEASPEPTP